MEINTNDILNSILESLDHVDYIRPEEIPNIDLYMDQVTTFMDEHFSSTRRYQQLHEEQSSPAVREEEVFQRAHAAPDPDLLF